MKRIVQNKNGNRLISFKRFEERLIDKIDKSRIANPRSRNPMSNFCVSKDGCRNWTF